MMMGLNLKRQITDQQTNNMCRLNIFQNNWLL